MVITYKNAKLLNVPTSLSDVYTVPAGATALVKAVHVSNKDPAADQVINCQWADASDAGLAASLAQGHVVPQKASYQLLDGVLVLEAGDKVQCSAGVVGKLDVTVSVLEMTT